NRPRMLLQVLLYRLFGFADVNRENDQPLARKLFAYFIDEGSFVLAVAAPGRPELEQNHLAFDGIIVELLTRGGGGVESRCEFLGFLGAGWRREAKADED